VAVGEADARRNGANAVAVEERDEVLRLEVPAGDGHRHDRFPHAERCEAGDPDPEREAGVVPDDVGVAAGRADEIVVGEDDPVTRDDLAAAIGEAPGCTPVPWDDPSADDVEAAIVKRSTAVLPPHHVVDQAGQEQRMQAAVLAGIEDEAGDRLIAQRAEEGQGLGLRRGGRRDRGPGAVVRPERIRQRERCQDGQRGREDEGDTALHILKIRGRSVCRSDEMTFMAPRKRPKHLRPKSPARVRKHRRSRSKGARGHQHPELIGLALVFLGIFLAIPLWLGWDGGYVGDRIDSGLEAFFGDGRVGVPLVLLALGGLMVARAQLVDVRPFRTGLVVLGLGIMTLLGEARGGATGEALDLIFGRLLGDTGTAVLGFFLLVTGALLVSGASLGALIRHSAHAAQKTAVAARRSVERVRIPFDDEPITQPDAPPVDGEAAYPDVVSERPAPPPVLVDQLDDFEPERPEPVFDMPSTEHVGYKLPDAGVLRRSHRDKKKGQPEKAIERTAEALLQALSNFGVEAHLIGQVVGPRVTRYELQLAPGTKVGKVASLKDDLAYALATTELRILAPIPGKQAVGVEVPNLSPNVVTLGDIFAEMPGSSSPLSVWLGKDISGASVHADLARMPHILIAGTTGSGKSGCINTMLCSILLRATPDEVRMILVDPKRVELGLYESIPHLLTPVVSSPKAAAAVLTNILTEMEHRYERMSLARARNLQELNRVLAERGEQTLPYLLVVIDELADLMMVSPQDVEDAVIRLAQKSRAVGIHLVLATQRPSVDVITGMIKANVPSRIAFAVSSQTDSRVILDTSGAESLLGQGDMLFKPLGTSRLQRVQGAYVSEEEIALIVEQCRGQRDQELDESLLEAPSAREHDGEDGDFDPDEDPLLDRAIEIVVQTQTASVSLIQRRLRVGYTRAGRLIDMLERRGIISGYEGSKPRRVLVGEPELERVLSEVAS
jgi:DNA segregation ATPase FtsK/SpoIIIE, S-DNA-T family